MTTRYELLTALLPTTGPYCSLEISEHRVQLFHDTLEALDSHFGSSNPAHNHFFALASFKDTETRTAENARALRAFFLDLDVDPDDEKKFPDQAVALSELRAFLKDTGLPSPTLVNSGRGIHVYWALTQEVETGTWRTIANRLKRLCAIKMFRADPAVTADPARVLRAPETFNTKDPVNPLPVEILRFAPPVDIQDFTEKLPQFEIAMRRPMDPVTQRLMGNKQSRFKTILEKTNEEKGCGQIAFAAANQKALSEPLWRACLSIAGACVDSARAIHFISRGHPDYTAESTEKKAAEIKGPYTCETFEGLNPEGCTGCTHKGKIKSPIVLGHEIAVAEKEPINEDTIEVTPCDIPDLPFPYIRGRAGGIYRAGGGEGEADELVYENDLYIVKFIDDPNDGMSALMRLHLPREPVKEFTIPFKDVGTKDKLREHLNEQGLLAYGKQMEAILRYVHDTGRALQQSMTAEKARTQFGWMDERERFIVGAREIQASGTVYSPPSSITQRLVSMYSAQGDLDVWKRVVDFYNRPGMELHAFTLFCGFGSPLMEFLNVNGGIVSLVSSESGTGKTTLLQVVNSIFGHPTESMLITEDTVNAKLNRMGILRNITSTTDEITNEEPQAVSDYIYQYLQGRGKNRMERSSNMERINMTNWSAINIVTANSYLKDKVYAIKALPEGELMRFMEFTLTRDNDISKIESDETFKLLFENYGLACEPYIQTVIQNRLIVQKRLEEMQRRIDKDAGFTQKERFWSAMAAAAMTGGWIAGKAGLHRIPIKRVYTWLLEELSRMRREVRSAHDSRTTAIGAFLQEHINDVLTINGLPDPRTKLQPAPIREPRQRLLVRYEPDTKLMFISVQHFREFCARRQISYQEVLQSLNVKGIYMGIQRKRLGKGTPFDVNVSALVLNGITDLLEDEDINALESDGASDMGEAGAA